MQNTESPCEESERTFKKLKSGRSSLPQAGPNSESSFPEATQPSFCIFSKLTELYREECDNYADDETDEADVKSHLLEKLVTSERLNTLIVNLHPGNKGYSLAFRTTPRDQSAEDTANMFEAVLFPYEEDELLRCIDNEELPPPHLLSILESHCSYLFYSGCIIAEVRDYRQAYPLFICDIHHVLLRPTLKSILADINTIAEDKEDWGLEEKQMLESQLLMANQPDMCLEPDYNISVALTQLNQVRQMWSKHKFRRVARKFSQVTVNRKRKLDQFTHRPGLELYENCIMRNRQKPKPGQAVKLPRKLQELKPVPIPNLEPPPIEPPSQPVVINQFKSYQRPKETSDCLPQLVEEYVLETVMPSKDKSKPRVYHIKLSILQRPSNSEYLGELYLDRDHKENERNGVACRFTLGSRQHANKYVQQFTEIFTESGRKSVKMVRLNPSNKNLAIAHTQVTPPQQTPVLHHQQQQQPQSQSNLVQQHLNQLTQALQNQTCNTPLVNGTVTPGISLLQQNQSYAANSSNISVLQGHLQGTSLIKPSSQTLSSQEQEVNAIANELMNSAQHFQAEAKMAKQQQQQKLSSVGNNTIINLLNSSPASNVNSDASAAVVNAINNTSLLPQQIQVGSQKLLARKMSLTNVANARVLNHNNLVVNNNRFTDLNAQMNQQQPQTITLTSVNSAGYANYTSVPVKQQVVGQRVISNSSTDANKSTLSALLVGTPAADRPDIISPTTNSLLLEKLANSSGGPKPQQQYMVQSPKTPTVVSPLSSPPQQNAGTINIQGLNFAQLQNLSGVQNVGFTQPILSLNVSSTGNIQGHPASFIVSLPVTTAPSPSTTTQVSDTGNSGVNSIGMTASTVVLANTGTSNLAQLVTGVKSINQQNIRAGGPATVSLSQGGQLFQLITPVQRPRLQTNIQQRTTPITIKMASPNANSPQSMLSSNTTLTQQLQKQAQLQQYQQLCLNQQQNIAAVAGKVRRRSNASDPQ